MRIGFVLLSIWIAAAPLGGATTRAHYAIDPARSYLTIQTDDGEPRRVPGVDIVGMASIDPADELRASLWFAIAPRVPGRVPAERPPRTSFARFRSTSVERKDDRLVVRGDGSFFGRQGAIVVDGDVRVDATSLAAVGTTVFDTSDVQSQPQRAVLDALGIEDEVVVRTHLFATRR